MLGLPFEKWKLPPETKINVGVRIETFDHLKIILTNSGNFYQWLFENVTVVHKLGG